MDEGCVGDLTVLEAKAAGLAAIIIWGAHRDTWQVEDIRFPVFSLGHWPAGPLMVRERHSGALQSARLGEVIVTRQDRVIADDDGVVVVASRDFERVAAVALEIYRKERRQAQEVMAGRSLREQLGLAEYLKKRAADSSITFREHLQAVGGAIET